MMNKGRKNTVKVAVPIDDGIYIFPQMLGMAKEMLNTFRKR